MNDHAAELKQAIVQELAEALMGRQISADEEIDVIVCLNPEQMAIDPDVIEAMLIDVLKELKAVPDTAVVIKAQDQGDCKRLVLHDVLAN
jgi:hypothetical protein